ncbi:MAG: SelB C-terminal domain-containing protein, partial [Deltaproteobacteria bacterium]
GGGTILDSNPEKHHAADERLLAHLRIFETGDLDARLVANIERLGEATPAALVARLGLPLATILQTAEKIAAQKKLVLVGRPPALLIHPALWQSLAKQCVEALTAFHAANPLLPGMAKEEARAALAIGYGKRREPPSGSLFDALLQSLFAQGKVEARGDVLRLTGRDVQLNPEERAATERITRAFAIAGLAVPSAREVLGGLGLDSARATKLLQILLKDKVLVKVADDLVFHAGALAKLKSLIAQQKLNTNRLNVGSFKTLTGLTRKYAIPLLEYLDRERITRREGDERIIL